MSNFGVPWSNAFPEWKFGFTTILLGLSVLALLVAAWLHFSGRGDSPPSKPRRWSRIAQAPLAVVRLGVVVFEVVSLTLAMIDQYPAWTVGRSNLEALTGKTCGLANDVHGRTGPERRPAAARRRRPVGDALGAVTAEGFDPNGIPADISADPVMEPQGSGNFADTDGCVVTGSEPGTEGGTTAAAGVNGSRARLPYGLDPARTPVMGSWRAGAQQPAVLRSAWYRLPDRATRGAARCWWSPPRAGSIRARSSCSGPPTSRPPRASPAAASASPTSARRRRGATCAPRCRRSPPRRPRCGWSPATTTWRRSTGSRSPRRASRSCSTLQEVVGSTGPGAAGLAGRAWRSRASARSATDGVTEVPKWRILPDRFGAEANSPVMDYLGGGPLGITELLVRATPVPTYLKDDWFRDWGSLQRLTPWYPDAQPARLDLGTATRSGLWSPAPLRLS